MRALLLWALVMAVMSLPAQERRVLEEPDVPKELGKCVLYETHHHSNGGRSYQLTCSAPIPDSVMVHLRQK